MSTNSQIAKIWVSPQVSDQLKLGYVPFIGDISTKIIPGLGGQWFRPWDKNPYKGKILQKRINPWNIPIGDFHNYPYLVGQYPISQLDWKYCPFLTFRRESIKPHGHETKLIKMPFDNLHKEV